MTHAGRVDAVCFDLDGTLYSQPELRIAMAMQLLRTVCTNPRTGYRALRILSAYRRAQESLRGRIPDCEISEAQVRLTCETTGSSREEVVRCVKNWFEEAPLPLLVRFVRPGLLEFLRRARARDVKLAVVSDYPAAAKLEAMGVAPFFDVVVCAQDAEVQRFKPDPKGLQVALQRLGVEGENALFVGDRPAVDVEAARLAGVRSVILGRRRADRGPGKHLVCRDFMQLTTVVLQ